MWHRLLLFLHLRNEFDWAPPALGPEVNHPYVSHVDLRCCVHCGGGLKHAIHRKPWDARRAAEVLREAAIERAAALAHSPDVDAARVPYPKGSILYSPPEDRPTVRDFLKGA
jgi:hypothetical protein